MNVKDGTYLQICLQPMELIADLSMCALSQVVVACEANYVGRTKVEAAIQHNQAQLKCHSKAQCSDYGSDLGPILFSLYANYFL